MNNQLLSTSIERVFRQLPSGLYQEFYLFFIHNLDVRSRNILSSKLDKIIVGKLYRKGRPEEKAILDKKRDMELYIELVYSHESTYKEKSWPLGFCFHPEFVINQERLRAEKGLPKLVDHTTCVKYGDNEKNYLKECKKKGIKP